VTALLPAPAPAPAGAAGLRATVRRLSAAQKGAHGAPAWSRFVNRPLGRVLAAVAFHLGLTPNAVTAASAACTASALGLLVLVPPAWPAALGVAALLVLGYALDAADGQLARLRGGGSPAGEWLDHMVDAVKSPSVHLALLVALYRFDVVPRGPLLLVPVVFCVVDSVTYFATMLNEALRASHGVATRSRPTTERAPLRRSLLTLPTDYGVLCCLFALYAAPGLFLPAYAAMTLAATAFLAVAAVRWYREIGRLPR
jgi:phosphatidylglycerophosphate synthase